VTEPRADGVDVHAGAEQEYGRRVPHPNYVVKSGTNLSICLEFTEPWQHH
jgi:hypothetical protein